MEINTHGIEEEENEHAVERKVYLDIIPMPPQSDIVVALKNKAGEEWKTDCTKHFAWKAAEHIIELEKKVESYEKRLHKYLIDNDPFTGWNYKKGK